MRAAVRTVLLAFLLAAINGSDVEPQLFDQGHFVEITVITFLSTASKCYLVTPSNIEIDLLESENLSEKYEYRNNTLSSCRVRINNLDKNDEGLWSLHAVIPSQGDTVNELKEQVYVVIRESDESKEIIDSEETSVSAENPNLSAEDTATSEESSDEQINSSTENSVAASEESSKLSSFEEDEAIEIQWLTDLQFITRTGLYVDINLPRTLTSEKCSLTKPDGITVDVEDGIAGVTAHSSSVYVSCRVVVGPMDASLLGKWTLCGSYEENNLEHRRCQNAEIVWRSNANPDSVWQTTINARFNHVVNFGGTLTPAVRGSGAVVSCHVVTPDNEDLLVTRDREYPNIMLVQDTDSTCSIAIGPIADSHLGDWDVYGTFNSAVWGYNEVRNPVNMELYDENHPYDQAYNVTTLNPTQHVINLGSTIPVEVTSTGAVDACQFTMPSGVTYYLTSDTLPAGVAFVTDNRVACQLSVGPITDDMLGDWLLIGKFSNRDVHTENRLAFTIIEEDPSNPIEEDRTIVDLDEQFIDTSIGVSHRVTIVSDIFSTFQSCHIRTPEGLQYTIMEGFHIPGIEVVTGSNVACGVTLEVSEDLIGNWTLISREIRSSQPTERRLPFIIYVEESVQAVPSEITITEGNAIHVHLANPTELHDTCKLKDPNGDEYSATLDGSLTETCGFMVPSVDAGHSGTWNIVYGTKIIYKAPILVNVNAREDPDTLYQNWVEYSSVNQVIGPEEAVYCQVQSPNGNVLFDGFGRCQVVVDSVMKDQHEGDWNIVVGLPGRIVTEKHFLNVNVIAADTKPVVKTGILTNKPTMELTCSVTSSQQKTGCLFRNPAGDVLVANQGVSEGRYIFHANQTSIGSEYYYTCKLQVTETVAADLGLWRCDLESEEENYYGFLAVLCPWAMQDPAVAESVVSEPVLVAQAASVSVEENEQLTLPCSARAPLRYCYFRAPNGTIFNVGPAMSSTTVEYVGAGLDAGECGARFQSLMSSDAGEWSCHASVNGQEQLHSIFVSVQEEVRVWSGVSGPGLSIQVHVPANRQIEYCRFVRFDGFGFSSDNVPFPYYLDLSTSTSVQISVEFSVADLLPWTVVTKLKGRDGEISRVTGGNWPESPASVSRFYHAFFVWMPLMLILTGCLIVAAAFAPSKNRRWAAERASSVRASMRDSMHRFSSFRKKQITDTNPAA